jgi:ATP-binding cassette subfamily B protein
MSQGIEKLMTVLVIWIGVTLIFKGELSIGALVAFQILAGRVISPLVQITGLINEFQEVALSVRMLGNIMNAPSEPGLQRGLRPPVRGKVSFDDVTFNYGTSTVPALDRVSFTIEPGQSGRHRGAQRLGQEHAGAPRSGPLPLAARARAHRRSRHPRDG